MGKFVECAARGAPPRGAGLVLGASRLHTIAAIGTIRSVIADGVQAVGTTVVAHLIIGVPTSVGTHVGGGRTRRSVVPSAPHVHLVVMGVGQMAGSVDRGRSVFTVGARVRFFHRRPRDRAKSKMRGIGEVGMEKNEDCDEGSHCHEVVSWTCFKIHPVKLGNLESDLKALTKSRHSTFRLKPQEH